MTDPMISELPPVLPSRDESDLRAGLADALLVPETQADMLALLTDLCTPAELHSLAERWHVAQLLDGTDLSYRDIAEGTGVSPTTITRVARFLRTEPHQGYRATIDGLAAKEIRNVR
ncbi:Trp family transcriptional regulator [Pseudoblastomonas halimionae]|nr:Trp family transcriptional regulator [Alteriqipengyuania halimionae]